MRDLDHLSFEPSRAERETERMQHQSVLRSIIPIMPESASRDLRMMSDFLEAREDRTLHDLFLEAVRYRAQFRRGIKAEGPQPNTVANLQIAEEIVERTKFVTKIARMQQYSELGEKNELQDEMRASEVLPEGEIEFWIFCADSLIDDGLVDRQMIASAADEVALQA